MSKVDAQRAMREARYAQNRASGPTRKEAAAIAATSAAPTVAPAMPAERAAAPRTEPPRAVPAAANGGRCGHKSMNGRACSREANHPEQSHRYG